MTTETPSFRDIGSGDELPEAWVSPYYIDDLKLRIAVARVNGALYAFDDMYESKNGPCPLSAGLLKGREIMSQCDGAQFDLKTGEWTSGPVKADRLRTYEVKEEGGRIHVRV
ncbi:hypothetical protein GCM10027568_00420 [Humibacter soli]